MTHGTRPPGLARPTAAPIAVVDYDGGGEDSRLRALALAAAHDGAAMTELVRATSSMLWRLCTALVDAASAEDLTQDTHARALRSLPSYRGDSSPRTWLATIARRVCADEIGAVTATANSDGIELMELTDAVNRLAPHRREALLLAAVVGLPYAQVADICQYPIGTVRSRVARAHDDLIKALSEEPAANPAAGSAFRRASWPAPLSVAR